jgi:aminopeptidase N
MKVSFPLFLILLLISNTHALQAQWDRQWTWGGPMDSIQSKFRVTHYQLDLRIDLEERRLEGTNTLSLEKLAETELIRLQLIEDYEVCSVVNKDGETLSFEQTGDWLDVSLGQAFPEKLTIAYKGNTPVATNPPWVGGFTWERDDKGNHWVGLSSQNEGGKLFMPCLDHPSNKPVNGASIKITVPKPYTVAANGTLVNTQEVGTDTTFHWETAYPIMNYNINFTIGKFHLHEQDYLSTSQDTVVMQVFVLEENKDKAPMLAKVLENSVQTQERYFGPYPFSKEKIAVVETPYLGMEHQTINGYGNNFQFVRMGEVWYDWLLHHELGHEWWGNKVSVADWADFWIHEGITTYGDWLFYEAHGGEEAYHQKVAETRRNILNEKPVAGEVNTPADEAYHLDVYYKGAYIMHSLRFLLGDQAFFTMLKDLATHPPFTYENQANTSGVTRFIEGYSPFPLGDFFDLYLYNTELPKVKIRKKGKKGYEVSLSNIDFSLPVEVATEHGVERMELSSNPVLIEGSAEPVVDPHHWFLMNK